MNCSMTIVLLAMMFGAFMGYMLAALMVAAASEQECERYCDDDDID